MIENQVSRIISDAMALRPKRSARTGWDNICCPLCTTRNETQDRKFRCGVLDTDQLITVTCFNCHFKARYKLGDFLSQNMRKFLTGLGIGKKEIDYLVYWTAQVRRQTISNSITHPELQISPLFPEAQLPPGSKSLQTWADEGCDDANFIETIAYLLSRGDEAVTATTYYWTPETKYDLYRRLIIPCYQHNRVVGWTARSISSDIEPRYHKNTPANFLFNVNLLSNPNRHYVFITEGTIDALVIEGIAALGGTLNEQQIAWINQSNKPIIVVPDRDKAGSYLIKIAIEQSWAVATPHYGKHQWWDADIKDPAAAVQRYGKLYTLRSIVATNTNDAQLIRQRTSYIWHGVASSVNRCGVIKCESSISSIA